MFILQIFNIELVFTYILFTLQICSKVIFFCFKLVHTSAIRGSSIKLLICDHMHFFSKILLTWFCRSRKIIRHIFFFFNLTNISQYTARHRCCDCHRYGFLIHCSMPILLHTCDVTQIFDLL